MSKPIASNGFSYKHMQSHASTRPRCPICGKDVFSRGGVHPQCAIEHSEREESRALREAIAAMPVPEKVKPVVSRTK